MLRRCLQMSTPRFGMAIAPQGDGGDGSGGGSGGGGGFLNEFGTMLNIRSAQMLADGRSIVETHGAYRFRIIERRTMDGYMVARVERYVNHNLFACWIAWGPSQS
jgi:Lon protease-like protein